MLVAVAIFLFTITGTSLLVDGGATMIALPKVEEILKGH